MLMYWRESSRESRQRELEHMTCKLSLRRDLVAVSHYQIGRYSEKKGDRLLGQEKILLSGNKFSAVFFRKMSRKYYPINQYMPVTYM